MKKITQDEIIQQFKEVHGAKYDYTKVDYITNITKVIIICRIHGEFLQAPIKHKIGRGCRKCGIIIGSQAAGITKKGLPSPKRHTVEQFIKEVREIHNNKYDYSKVVYITTKTPVIIICPKHGEFLQAPIKHKIGRGCHLCSRGKNSSNGQLQWLGSLQKELIYEYRIPENKLRPVDGYDPITNTIYQYHGDYFHGNPDVYSPHEFNKLLKKTYGELYEKTIRQDEELLRYGYNLVIMWERDWKKR